MGDLTRDARAALARGDAAAARGHFQRLVEADGRDPQQWVGLAVACQRAGDEEGEEKAIAKALALDPYELVALILRANLYERRGERHKAANAYAAVLSVAPPPERVHPDLRAALANAQRFRQAYDRDFGAFLDRYLEEPARQFEGAELRRFRDSVDIVLARKRRYDSQPALYFFPHLPCVEFFDRERFPWLDAVEAASDAIRDEFLQVLGSEEGFEPYMNYPPGTPLNQWVELNKSPRWSAFNLMHMGGRNEANAARCPRTMQALAGVPSPDMPGRTPNAMFSLLKPRTRIPPHCGVTNARLVAHLPLIIPGRCGFRVGNDTREWVPGKAWVFDDTIEHEAWNDSDELRVVLIFDIWHPDLTAAERAMVTAMTRGTHEFVGGDASFQL